MIILDLISRLRLASLLNKRPKIQTAGNSSLRANKHPIVSYLLGKSPASVC